MPKAKKLPSGNWRVQVFLGYENGKKIMRSVTAPTKKEAELEAAKIALKRDLTESKHIPLTEAIDMYIQQKSEQLSPCTIRGYRIVQRNAFPFLISREITAITEQDIMAQMLENMKKYKEKTIVNQFSLLRSVLDFHGISTTVPDYPRKTKTAIKVPTLSEVEKIIHILRGTDIECQILLALTCSLRQSEIAALRAQNIDGDIVKVSGAMVYDEHSKLVWKPTNKTADSQRVVVMPKRLAQLMKEKCIANPNGLLFTTSPILVLKKFQKLLNQNNLPPYTVHAMRHAFAAFMHHSGVPDQYIMKMGGWSSPNIMKSVYQYAFEDETMEMKKAVNAKFDSLE